MAGLGGGTGTIDDLSIEELEQIRDAEWAELKEFAQESGFEVKERKSGPWPRRRILLPLGEIGGTEYGVCLDYFRYAGPGRAHYTVCAYGWGEDGKEIEQLQCYTVETVIRTVELGDRSLVIERRKKRDIDEIKGLIYAFKFKELGTLDPTFLNRVHKEVCRHLPVDAYREFVEDKFSEFEERLEEAMALGPALPRLDYINIVRNIVLESSSYIPSWCQEEFFERLAPFKERDPDLFKTIKTYIFINLLD